MLSLELQNLLSEKEERECESNRGILKKHHIADSSHGRLQGNVVATNGDDQNVLLSDVIANKLILRQQRSAMIST
jgi:hypothetical protein